MSGPPARQQSPDELVASARDLVLNLHGPLRYRRMSAGYEQRLEELTCKRTGRDPMIRVDQHLLVRVLRTASQLPRVARSSQIPGYPPSELRELLAEMLRMRWVVGVSVEGPMGDEFFLAGLTTRGQRVLEQVRDARTWRWLEAVAKMQDLPLSVENIASLLSELGRREPG